MDEVRLSFLRRLIATPGPSGFEQPVQQVIYELVEPYSDEVRRDTHGNLIAALNAAGKPRVMLTAHCDELGFLIRYSDELGFLYFSPIGAHDPASLPGDRVIISTPSGPVPGVVGGHVGRRPVHLTGEPEFNFPGVSELWIDIGASSREEALKRVPPGSAAVRAATLETLYEDIVVSHALDNRLGVFTIVEAMRSIFTQQDRLKAGIFLVTTAQEEVGARGIRTVAHAIDPQIAIVVDLTFTSDFPGAAKHAIGDLRINGGPVLTMGANINPRVYRRLVQAAEDADLHWQISPQVSQTFTDTDMLQLTRSGVATGLVSIPGRYIHTASEVASLKDMEQAAEIIARFVLALDENVDLIP